MNITPASGQPADLVIGPGLAQWAREQSDSAPDASAELRLRIAQIFAGAVQPPAPAPRRKSA